MKKIILTILAAVAVIALVIVFIWRQQSGYTKVLTSRIARQDLTTVVSGTGQIKPKTYMNVGATSFGRITHFYVKEGDLVKQGQTVATIENVQQEANVNGQQAAIAAAKTDISSYIAAEKTAEANVEHAKADLEQKQLDWDRAQSLYKDGILAKQDYDAKKAAYDLDVASLAQAVAGLNQAKANTDSARGHMQTQVANLRVNQDLLVIGLELVERRAAMVEQLLGMPQGSLAAFAGMFGVSGICNVLGAVRLARHLNLGSEDNVVTIATDGFDRYPSVLADLEKRRGPVDASSFEEVFRGGTPDEILDVRGKDEKQRLFDYKEQVWSAFHYSHAYLESMQSQSFWDGEFGKVEAIDRALISARK